MYHTSTFNQKWAQLTLYQKRSATIFSTSKSSAQNAQLNFLISEARRNFRNELFDSVDGQCNSAIVERHFRTKLKRNLTPPIKISQNNAIQTRLHGGAYRGRAPQLTACAPPQLTARAPQTKIVPPQARTVPRRN